MSPQRTSHGGAGSEEAAQPIDGVPEDSWGPYLASSGWAQRLLGCDVRGKIAFGVPNPP